MERITPAAGVVDDGDVHHDRGRVVSTATGVGTAAAAAHVCDDDQAGGRGGGQGERAVAEPDAAEERIVEMAVRDCPPASCAYQGGGGGVGQGDPSYVAPMSNAAPLFFSDVDGWLSVDLELSDDDDDRGEVAVSAEGEKVAKWGKRLLGDVHEQVGRAGEEAAAAAAKGLNVPPPSFDALNQRADPTSIGGSVHCDAPLPRSPSPSVHTPSTASVSDSDTDSRSDQSSSPPPPTPSPSPESLGDEYVPGGKNGAKRSKARGRKDANDDDDDNNNKKKKDNTEKKKMKKKTTNEKRKTVDKNRKERGGGGDHDDDSDDDHDGERQCLVCGARATTGTNYGAQSCHGCKAFFQRNVKNRAFLLCNARGECTIDQQTAKRGGRYCPTCRFMRCVRVGMRVDTAAAARTKHQRCQCYR